MMILKKSNEYENGKKKQDAFVFFKFKNVEVPFKCEKHGVVTATAIEDENGKIYQLWCPICEREKEDARKREEQKKAEEKLTAKYKSMNVKPEFYSKTLGDYKPQTQKQHELLEAVKELVATKEGKLIVLGGNGTGKTMLATIAVKEMGGVIYTMFRLSLKMRSLDKRLMTEEQFVNSLIEAPLLVIDEIGRSKGSEFERNLLSDILDNRHTENKPFILLSNTHFARDCPNRASGCEKCFERYFDNDLLSRFRQGSKTISIEKDAPDWRNRKNQDIGGSISAD